MIKSIIPAYYQLRGNIKAVIKIIVDSFVQTKDGVTYTVNDFVVNENGSEQLNNTKQVYYTNERINEIDQILESNFNYTGLSKTEKEWAKIVDALLIDTTTNLYEDGTTIYRLNPNQWERC